MWWKTKLKHVRQKMVYKVTYPWSLTEVMHRENAKLLLVSVLRTKENTFVLL